MSRYRLPPWLADFLRPWFASRPPAIAEKMRLGVWFWLHGGDLSPSAFDASLLRHGVYMKADERDAVVGFVSTRKTVHKSL